MSGKRELSIVLYIRMTRVKYSFQASKGTYSFKAGESFTVDDGPLKKDITLPVCLLSGSIIREKRTGCRCGLLDETDW